MINIKKIVVVIAAMHGISLVASYNAVSMPNPDTVEAVSNVAESGVIDTSSVGIADRSPKLKDTKLAKKRSLKGQAKANKEASRKKQKQQENVQVVVAKKPHVQEIDQEDLLPVDAYEVDAIEAVVFAPEGTSIVVSSDLSRPSLDGRARTLEDLVYEKLMLLDAQKFRMFPDEDMIDKHLAAVQRDNNLTLDDLKSVFKSAGYSYEEGREQFGMISIINQILDFKIRSRLIVPEREVVAYYNENPEVEEASYHIQVGIIPFAENQSIEQQKKSIESFINHDIGFMEIEWQEPFWIEKNDMAEDKQFLIDLNPGEISEVQETTDGFQVFKKIADKPERVRTLEERYREISELLRKPKYEQLVNEYRQELMETGAVKYLN